MFTASKSYLEKFFSGCAYRAFLYRRWNLKKEFMSKPMRFGIAVHGAIETSLRTKKDVMELEWDPVEVDVLDRAQRAVNWLQKNGYEVIATEVEHIAPLSKTIQLYGIIDCIAKAPSGEIVLIDWKTSKNLWAPLKLEGGEIVYVGAQGWQGPIYLTPPYESAILEEWPKKMLYVVIPEGETVEAYSYHKTDADDRALLRACELVRVAEEDGNFPKNTGTFTCNSCDFKQVCWQTIGWQKYYDARNKHAKKEEEGDEE